MISRYTYLNYASQHDPAHTNICEHTALHVTFDRIISYEIESKIILKFQNHRKPKFRNVQDPENFKLQNRPKFSGS